MNVALYILTVLPVIVVIICILIPGVTIDKIGPSAVLGCGIGFAVCAGLQGWDTDSRYGFFAIVSAIVYTLTAPIAAVILHFVSKSLGL